MWLLNLFLDFIYLVVCFYKLTSLECLIADVFFILFLEKKDDNLKLDEIDNLKLASKSMWKYYYGWIKLFDLQ